MQDLGATQLSEWSVWWVQVLQSLHFSIKRHTCSSHIQLCRLHPQFALSSRSLSLFLFSGKFQGTTNATKCRIKCSARCYEHLYNGESSFCNYPARFYQQKYSSMNITENAVDLWVCLNIMNDCRRSFNYNCNTWTNQVMKFWQL